jgi:hypothetical protein
MSDTQSATAVIAGLSVGIAFVVVFSIFSSHMPQSTVKTKVGADLTSKTHNISSIEAAKHLPVVKAFLAKYPDASIRTENEAAEMTGAARTGIPAIDFYRTVHWVAYYNNTTGFIINENNVPIDDKVVTSTNSHKLNISNTMMLTVHFTNRSSVSSSNLEEQQPDKIWLGCLTDTSSGSGMSTELGSMTIDDENQTATENRMIQYIEKEYCFPFYSGQSNPMIEGEPTTNDNKTLLQKLKKAQEAVSQLYANETVTYEELPISALAVDEKNLTLDVVIDDRKSTMSKEVYAEKLNELLGDIPIKISFGHYAPVET